ncbi:hypothetical protein LWI29_033489 [Acer saccharum]|uniref:(+)-neomenthol dehydrogenase n=1 Tax=Acer saccharum TaxID=4024 RepID=A0AA39VTJ8_ACESA|nr:hypothetical protein LWI29_033489 [Acer saccharum]
MAGSSTFLSSERYAVVTGGDRGIGFEICRQLASNGVKVVLTAIDKKRAVEAVEKLKEADSGLSHLLVSHQLDVTDFASIDSLADFIRTRFGKLDILPYGEHVNWNELTTQNFNMAEECVKTNYYGAKIMAETLIPLLQSSDSARIVNVSALNGALKNIPSKWAQAVLGDVESLTEEKIDKVLNKFLEDFKEENLEKEGWPTVLSAYVVSKTALNAYTRILAKKYPNFLINCVNPGYVRTEMTCNTGLLSAAEGAHYPLTLALLPIGGPSGLFFDRNEIYPF